MIKLRRMTCTNNVAQREMNLKMQFENMKRRYYFGDIGVDGMIILKRI
jgi:hypothetical protein